MLIQQGCVKKLSLKRATDTALRRLENKMKEFKEETRRENRERNKQWSNLAKKMGTLVEDLIAPAEACLK